MGKTNFETHDFYCINCGKKALTLPRKRGHRHSAFHRKKLYCIFCKQEINMVECKNDFEAQKFLEDFADGLYVKEAEESLNITSSKNF